MDEGGERIVIEKACRAEQERGGGLLAHVNGGSEYAPFEHVQWQGGSEGSHRRAVHLITKGIEQAAVECVSWWRNGKLCLQCRRFQRKTRIACTPKQARKFHGACRGCRKVVVSTRAITEATEGSRVIGKGRQWPREQWRKHERWQDVPVSRDGGRAVICVDHMQDDGVVGSIEMVPMRPPIAHAAMQLDCPGHALLAEHQRGVREIRPKPRRPTPPILHSYGLPIGRAPRTRYEPLRLPDFRQCQLWRHDIHRVVRAVKARS